MGSDGVLTIYHIEGRRSQSVVWLCEELGLAYELVFTRGDLAASRDAICAVSPLMPLAPTVRYGDTMLMETGAILEWLLSQHGDGRLAPPPSSPDYAHYLMWLHFAEGTAMSRISSDLMRMRASGETEVTPNMFPGTTLKLVGTRDVIAFIEAFLAEHPYFGGEAFSAADIMMYFPSKLLSMLPGVQEREYPRYAAWRRTVESRPAFKRMLAAALPDGKVPNQDLTAALLTGAKPKSDVSALVSN